MRIVLIAVLSLMFLPSAATPQVEVVETEPVLVALGDPGPVQYSVTPAQGGRDDEPEFDPLNSDEFLGEVGSAVSNSGFSERVDQFSGTVHINMVDLVLPGNGGLDIVVQRYYSSNTWNRVDDATIPRHVPAADISDRLGGNGWQLHMGKLLNAAPSPDGFTTLIMPDGSTHRLYNRDDLSGDQITGGILLEESQAHESGVLAWCRP